MLFRRFRKVLNWKPTPKPEVKLGTELYGQFKAFRLPAIFIIMTMVFGTIGYMLDGFTLLDAIYQSGITFTTVGFGEIAEISAMGRLFTITLIIAGFVIFSLSVGILVNELNKGEISKLLKERNMLYKIARLRKHFVICHHNEYTIEVSKQLRENHIPFVVIDPRPDLEEIAKEYKYPYFIQEEPHTELAMLKSHLSSAKGVIVLSNSISDNIALIASVRLFEKEHNLPVPYYIIASATTLSDVDKLKKLGADSVVSPTKITAQRVSAMAARPDMENLLEQFLYKSDTPLDLEEIFVPKYSWIVLKKLKEARLREIANVSVIGIRKSDGKFLPMPTGDMLINSECTLLVIGTSKGLNYTKALILKRDKPQELKYV